MAAAALSVPAEIVSEIFLYICNSYGVSLLKPCLLVCKHWSAIALPLLYRDVLLINSTIGTFAQNMDSSNSVHVRTLSIRIDSVGLTQGSQNTQGASKLQQLWSLLDMLPPRIKLMTKLEVLSLVVPDNKSNHFGIPRKSIAGILENVPSSCTQLELDTKGCDISQSSSVHLCEVIHSLFQQLSHLRLRLSTLCGTIFLSNEPASAAPHLESLVINCIPGTIYGSRSLQCGTFHETHHTSLAGEGDAASESRLVLARTARAMYDGGKFPKAAHLCIVDAQDGNLDDGSSYAVLNRRDIVRNETWCMPFRNIRAGEEMDSFLMRTAADGREVLAHPWALQALAEGTQWSETTNGVRLPTATLRAESSELGRRIVRELPILTTEEWKARYPRKSCTLWRNERQTGMCLLKPLRLDGLSDTRLVMEETPDGWVRHVTDLFPESSAC